MMAMATTAAHNTLCAKTCCHDDAATHSFPCVLPTELLARVAAYLLGVELFALSHANSAALKSFSLEALWVDRLSATSTAATARTHARGASDSSSAHAHATATARTPSSKQRYIRKCASFAFPGRATQQHAQQQHTTVAPVVAVCDSMRTAFGSNAKQFSLTICFSISPDDPLVHTGGVLIGAQQTQYTDDATSAPSSYAQLVYIDAQRDLFCSAMHSMQHVAPVARALEPCRWYNLALVYDGECECVYLDGERVATVHGQLPTKWRNLYVAQVGTGFVDVDAFAAVSGGATTDDSVGVGIGWHAFHGVVDSCRVFRFALSLANVQQVTVEGTDDSASIAGDDALFDTAVFSIECPTRKTRKLQRVWCSRPSERWCQPLAVERDDMSVDDMFKQI